MTVATRGFDTGQIRARAREVSFTETVLRIIAGFFFYTGWAAAKILGSLWTGFVFCGLAIQEGWRAARPQRRE